MTNYYKTPAAARKVGISYTRLIGLMRYDKVAPPERDTSGDFVWTDADLLAAYRYCLATGAFGQSRSINGRSVSFPSADEVRKTIGWLEQRIATASATNPGVAYARFDDPV